MTKLFGFISLITIFSLSCFANEAQDYNEDPLMTHAIRTVLSSTGDKISIGKKAKDLIKFGKTINVGSSARSTIWRTGADQANETYPAANTNSIDSVSSSSTTDTTTLIIEGHTESGHWKYNIY